MVNCDNCSEIVLIDGSHFGIELSTYEELAAHVIEFHSKNKRQHKWMEPFWLRIAKEMGIYAPDLVSLWATQPEQMEFIYENWIEDRKSTCSNAPCINCIVDRLNRVIIRRKREAESGILFRSSSGKDINLIISKRTLKRGICDNQCTQPKYTDGMTINSETCNQKCNGNHEESEIHWHIFGSPRNLVHTWKTGE